MTILVTNDDGIFADGLWALVRELKNIAPVVVVAPDREQSAIGTAVTLHQPLRVRRVRPLVPETDAYAVEGTPSDCVILALTMLIGDGVGMVVSGINRGANLGEDVLISGTVGAALQGYLRGLPALAISAEAVDNHCLDTAAGLAALLAKQIGANALPNNIFLNVNLPNLSLDKIKGVEITQLATGTHTDAAEQGNDGRREHYWLVRRKVDKLPEDHTDVHAVGQGNISITPLHVNWLNRSAPELPGNLCYDLFRGLQKHSPAGGRAAGTPRRKRRD
jgi:5'-nucleotidase